MGLRDLGERSLLDTLVGGALSGVLAATPRFIHLFTTEPAGEGEVASTNPSAPGADLTLPGEIVHNPQGYQPQPVPRLDPTGTNPLSGWVFTGTAPTTMKNNSQYVFSPLPACTVVAWGLSFFSPTTHYALLLTQAFPTATVVPAGGTLIIPVNSLTVTLD